MDTCWKKKTWTTQKNVEEDSRKRTGTSTFDLESGCKVSCRQDKVENPCLCATYVPVGTKRIMQVSCDKLSLIITEHYYCFGDSSGIHCVGSFLAKTRLL